MALAQEGYASTRNLDYERAEAQFARLDERYPAHPAPPLFRAVVLWLGELFERQELDLDLFVAPSYFTQPAQRSMPVDRYARFQQLIRDAQARAQAILRHNPSHPDARYFLGTSFGVLAGFTLTIDRSYLKAFRHAKEAYRYLKALVEEDPQYYDAYMHVGVYEYAAASVPWYVKWLAALIGFRGNKEEGLRHLALAAEHAQYVADDARMLLMVLLVRERRYPEALSLAERLHRTYPRNYLLHLNQAQILERMARPAEAARRYLEVIRRAEAKRPNYHKLPLPRFRYAVGQKLFTLGQWETALELFERAVDDPDTPVRERALSHLGAGQVRDLLNQREQALSHYRRVLAMEEVENSHALARRYLRQPYKASGGRKSP